MSRLALLSIVIAVSVADARAFQSSCTTERANVNGAGQQANAASYYCEVSANGRFVVFDSAAANLVPNDTNGKTDVFVRDLQASTTELVSVSSSGAQGDNTSGGVWTRSAISADGRYVAFASYASNLVPGDTNASSDIFVRDRWNGQTERVSLTNAGLQSDGPDGGWWPSMSSDGRFVAFVETNLDGEALAYTNVYVRDRVAMTTVRVSSDANGVVGNKMSDIPSISADGRFVAFESRANNLVPGDLNHRIDVFVRDLAANTTTRVNVDSAGVEADNIGYTSFVHNLAISADGRTVVWDDWATNLVPSDTNMANDVFAHDLVTGQTDLVSASPIGAVGSAFSFAPSVSADGRYVVFESYAGNLAANAPYNGYTQIFVRDRSTATTTLSSVDTTSGVANGGSDWPAISGDGSVVAFNSYATDLAPGDTNALLDIYVRRCVPPPSSYCTAKVNSLGCTPAIGSSGTPSASSTSAFDVSATQVINNKSGILFYGLSPSAIPFHNGWMCVAAPRVRTAIQTSGGNPPPDDCSGVFSYDFNARIQSGADPLLAPGVEVFCEFWYRDPKDPRNDGFSDALRFTIES